MDEKRIKVTEEELEMLALLRKQPDLSEAVHEVLSLAKHEGWDANEVEAGLIEATRKLGRATVGSWAAGKANQLEDEMEQVEPPLHRHKKTLSWLCTFGAVKDADCVWPNRICRVKGIGHGSGRRRAWSPHRRRAQPVRFMGPPSVRLQFPTDQGMKKLI